MSDILSELKDDLINAIDGLKGAFEGWTFHAKNGLTNEDIDDLEFIPYVKDESNDSLIDFDEFQKLVSRKLESDDGIKKSEFDWDSVANEYENVIEKYDAYYSLTSQIEGNLTGDQTIETAEVLTREDLIQSIINYLEESNKIYSIQMQYEQVYMLSSDFKKELNDFL